MRRTALQLALPKVGIAWMFALLTVNFNRVTIYDMRIAAVVVTLLLGIYPLFAPIQPLLGRWIDRHPVLGYRRGPYLLGGMLGSGLIFPALPWVAEGLQQGSPLALAVGAALMVIFGVGIALIANTYLDLVADVTDERSRSGVFAVAWTAQTAAIVLWAFVFQALMPDYTPGSMRLLYDLTPLVCLATTLPGIAGLERRLSRPEARAAAAAPPRGEPAGNPLDALRVLRENAPARLFFAFVFLAITGIFLQDAVLEVYGARVLGMSLAATDTLQQVWNGAVLVAMLVASPIVGSMKAGPGGGLPAAKRRIASAGALVAIFALGALALTSARGDGGALYPVLALMGGGVGVFTAVTVTMMSDMTVEGATGRYLGLWSMAQAFGTSFAFVASGALHTALVESGLMAAGPGFAAIFGAEALAMLLSLVLLQAVSVEAFRGAARRDLARLAARVGVAPR